MAARRFFVYVLTNRLCSVLYVGVTNDLARRVLEHREGTGSAFTARYRTHRLVYVEEHARVLDAIAREKSLKRMPRPRKRRLIESQNPEWLDLFEA